MALDLGTSELKIALTILGGELVASATEPGIRWPVGRGGGLRAGGAWSCCPLPVASPPAGGPAAAEVSCQNWQRAGYPQRMKYFSQGPIELARARSML
jgi:hypothetical protein